MDVLQKINSNLLIEEDYFDELDEMAKNNLAEADDKKKIQSFFSLTEKIQEIQASKSDEDKQEDFDMEEEDEEVSVVLDKDEVENLHKDKPTYYDMKMLMDTDSDEDDEDSFDKKALGPVSATTEQEVTASPVRFTPTKTPVAMGE